MSEREKKEQDKGFEFSFLSELPEDTMIEGVYLAFKVLEYRQSPATTVKAVGSFFGADRNEKKVAKLLIDEIERVNGDTIRNLTEESVNTFISNCSDSALKIVSDRIDREDPEAEQRAKEVLRKWRSVNLY